MHRPISASTNVTATGITNVVVYVDPSYLPINSVPVPIEGGGERKKKKKELIKTITIPVQIDAYSPVCEIKRSLSVSTGIPPQLQRLSLLGATDQFSFPSSLKLAKRSTRHENHPLIIKSYNDAADEKWLVSVDQNDTILDLKFIISPLVNMLPEYIKLYSLKSGQRVREELRDDLILNCLPAKHVLRILFEIPSRISGHGNIHRSSSTFLEYTDPSIRTVGHLFRWAVAKYSSKPYLGTRTWKGSDRGDYVWQTYAEIGVRVSEFGSGLLSLGLRKGDSIGIIGVNRSEWIIADFACAIQSLISVPLYDTLGADAVEFIINHANVKAIVTARANLEQIHKAKSKCPSLQYIIFMDEQQPDKDYIQTTGNSGNNRLYTHTVSGIENTGKMKSSVDHLPSPDDLYTICYTSGTTGQPKGALITHKNMLSGALGISTILSPSVQTSEDVVLSYLPLAHIYERSLQVGILHRGNGVGFFQGDTTKLTEDVSVLKPTFFPGVPRVWQRIYDRITAQIAESNIITRTLFNRAYHSKLDQIEHGVAFPTSLYDNIVFKKVAEKFGGKLRIMSSGAAPISDKVAEFLKIEGYGLTETCAALSVTDLDLCYYGNVGHPLPCCEVKLVDVPDMDYYSTDTPYPRGEVWVRGSNVFKGYYKADTVSKECLTDDGWFMTGDIGLWLNDGNLKIIDRKKNLFKLSQGEYIRPEYLETIYKQHKYIANLYVHGESTQNYLVAVVVPDFESIKPTLINYNIQYNADHKELIKNPKFKLIIKKAIEEQNVKEKLRGFECVKDFILVADDFTVENGLMTPTFKLKRHQAKIKYEKEIKDLYEKGIKEEIKAKL